MVTFDPHYRGQSRSLQQARFVYERKNWFVQLNIHQTNQNSFKCAGIELITFLRESKQNLNHRYFTLSWLSIPDAFFVLPRSTVEELGFLP